MRTARLALAAIALALFGTASMAADSYPSRPVRIVVNSTPGGLTDVIARLISARISQEAGQPVVIDNRPGSVVGIDVMAKSPPDGYVVGLFANAISALPALLPSLPFNPEQLAPVALVATAPMVLITGPRSNYHTFAEYLADAKARPGMVSIASGGSGTLGHLLAEQLQAAAGISLIHVPYKGGAPAAADVMAGHVPAFFDTVGTTTPLAREGRVRPLAVVGSKRAPALADVPTTAELGLPDVNAVSWFGMFAPAGTPPDVVAKLNGWVRHALQAPEVRERMASLGTTPEGGTPQAMGELLKSEIPRWTKLVRDRNITVN